MQSGNLGILMARQVTWAMVLTISMRCFLQKIRDTTIFMWYFMTTLCHDRVIKPTLEAESPRTQRFLKSSQILFYTILHRNSEQAFQSQER